MPCISSSFLFFVNHEDYYFLLKSWALHGTRGDGRSLQMAHGEFGARHFIILIGKLSRDRLGVEVSNNTCVCSRVLNGLIANSGLGIRPCCSFSFTHVSMGILYSYNFLRFGLCLFGCGRSGVCFKCFVFGFDSS